MNLFIYMIVASTLINCSGSFEDKIDTNLKQLSNTHKRGCILPNQLKYGRYTIRNDPPYNQSSLVEPATIIHLTCNGTKPAEVSFYCLGDEWEPPIETGKCGKPENCGPLIPSISEEEPCYINDVETPCPSSSKPGTKIFRKCRGFYSNDGLTNTSYVCQGNGKWNPSYSSCQPECGAEIKKDEYPWVVALYDSNNQYFCSGTIVSPYHVLTAAQCFEKQDNGSYSIKANQNYKNFSVLGESSQTREVKRVVIPENYNEGYFYRYDLALLEVERAFNLSVEIRPICVDWNSLYEEFDFIDGNNGVTVEWELEGREEVLKRINRPYKPRLSCFQNYSTLYEGSYFTNDKFCAGYIKGPDIRSCKENSGRGLYFNSDGSRYFIRGVSSYVNPVDCLLKLYDLYVKVSSHLDWLMKEMSKTDFQLKFRTSIENADQDTYNVCILPKQIENGKFSRGDGLKYVAGAPALASTIILLSCTGSNTPTSAFYCMTNKWQPPVAEAKCTERDTCPSLKNTESEQVVCTFNDLPVSCEKPKSNTTAKVECTPFFEFKDVKPIYTCVNGNWGQQIIRCNPKCGEKRINAQTLITNSNATVPNEYIWVVSIYDAAKHHICGGTVISRYYVLSAAHCFTNDEGKITNEHSFTLIAGKYHRNFNIHEEFEQRRSVKTLHVYENYRGSVSQYKYDIALIEVDTAFTLSKAVQPVCIDWEKESDDEDLIDKNGVVAGWGLTKPGGMQSDDLRQLEVPLRPRRECKVQLDEFGETYVTIDKICAGFVNKSTNVCNGDSGGGLYFKGANNRYYIRGIVSLSSKTKLGCNVEHYALYTQVSKYIEWIQYRTRRRL